MEREKRQREEEERRRKTEEEERKRLAAPDTIYHDNFQIVEKFMNPVII